MPSACGRRSLRMSVFEKCRCRAGLPGSPRLAPRLGCYSNAAVVAYRVLQGETDFFGDAAVVELGDDVQLRSQVVGDANREGPHLTCSSRVLRESGCLTHVSHLLILDAADEPDGSSSSRTATRIGPRIML